MNQTITIWLLSALVFLFGSTFVGPIVEEVKEGTITLTRKTINRDEYNERKQAMNDADSWLSKLR